MHIGADQLFLRLELLADEVLEDFYIHVEQCGEGAYVNDVLEQLPLARIAVFTIANGGKRYPDDGDIIAKLRLRHRLGAVVEQIAAGLDQGHVFVPGLRVHRHQQIGAAAGTEMACFGDAHLVPGR